MSRALPIAKVKLPSCLNGQRNGVLSESILVPCGIANYRLVEPAARSFKALCAAAQAAGFNVWTTGTYRSLDSQVRLFTSRYSSNPVPGQTPKLWNNRRWWKLPGVAAAATPGKSNHGLGLACDFALKNGTRTVSVNWAFVNWMCDNAHKFGWSAELQSENWHWRAVHGDTIPQAVLDYEKGLGGTL